MTKSQWVKLGAIAVLFVVVIVILKGLGIFTWINLGLEQAILWVDRLGVWGLFAFSGLYVLTTLLCISGAALTLGAGALFGVVKGSVLVSIASTLAATCAFLVGRYGLRDWVNQQIQTQPKFQAVNRAVAQGGWKIVGLVRLSPLFPFVFLNYAFGVTQVSLRDYVLASWIGMMPGTVLYVYLGAVGKVAANTVDRPVQTQTTLLQTGLTIVGLVATEIATILITRSAQQALQQEIDRPVAQSSLN